MQPKYYLSFYTAKNLQYFVEKCMSKNQHSALNSKFCLDFLKYFVAEVAKENQENLQR